MLYYSEPLYSINIVDSNTADCNACTVSGHASLLLVPPLSELFFRAYSSTFLFADATYNRWANNNDPTQTKILKRGAGIFLGDYGIMHDDCMNVLTLFVITARCSPPGALRKM